MKEFLANLTNHFIICSKGKPIIKQGLLRIFVRYATVRLHISSLKTSRCKTQRKTQSRHQIQKYPIRLIQIVAGNLKNSNINEQI